MEAAPRERAARLLAWMPKPSGGARSGATRAPGERPKAHQTEGRRRGRPGRLRAREAPPGRYLSLLLTPVPHRGGGGNKRCAEHTYDPAWSGGKAHPPRVHGGGRPERKADPSRDRSTRAGGMPGTPGMTLAGVERSGPWWGGSDRSSSGQTTRALGRPRPRFSPACYPAAKGRMWQKSPVGGNVRFRVLLSLMVDPAASLPG